jgi:hypothetical protein
MSKHLYALTLALFTCSVSAQFGALTDAEVIEKTSISDPAKVVTDTDNQWLAFSIPVTEGTWSPCCWTGPWDSQREVGCSLQRSHQSYGSNSDSPLADNVIVFARSHDGEVSSLKVVGEHCPVDGDGQTVTWIGTVDTQKGLDWLEATARSSTSGSAGDSALYAMAMHEGQEASTRLYSLALEPGEDLAEESIFWLGEARGSEGLEMLLRLLDELPPGDIRQEINFALAQNGTKPAVDQLVSISKTDHDPEQRSGALFWLAEEVPEVAQTLLLEVLTSETDEDVLEQAVFAISQLPSEMGTPMLLSIARDKNRPKEVRRQALFWLAESDDDEAVAALVELLTR